MEQNLFGDVKFKREFLDLIEDTYTIVEKGETKDAMLRRYYTTFGASQLGWFEQMYDKDIYSFTKTELLQAYASLGFSDLSAIRSTNSMVKKYMDYAYNKTDVKVVTPATSLIKEDDLKECLSQLKRTNKYMTKNELYTAIKQTINEQDQAILLLLWEGVKGLAFKELINLTKDDLNYEQSYLQVENRKLKLNDLQKEIVNGAINQTIYRTRVKGLNASDTAELNKYDLYESEHIFRNLIYKGKIAKTPYLDDMAIKNRITQIKKEVDKRYWTANTIYVSGIVYRMLEEKKDWDFKSVREYLELYSIGLNPYNVLDIMAILTEKMNREKNN